VLTPLRRRFDTFPVDTSRHCCSVAENWAADLDPGTGIRLAGTPRMPCSVVRPTRHSSRPAGSTKAIASLASVAALAALALGGCSYQLVSPPSRMINLQSAKTAAPGETVVGVRGAGYSGILDPSAMVASGGVRHGVADHVEIDAEASWARIDAPGYSDLDPNIYAGRVGAKWSSRTGRSGVFAGLGGGYAPVAGAFSAVDVGAAVQHTNCYIVPFASVTALASLPIGAKQVDFRSSVDGSVLASSKAPFTYGVGLGAGLEVPIDRSRCRQGLTPARLQLGLSNFTLLPREHTVTHTNGSSTTDGDAYGVIGLALGVEVPF